LYPTTPSANGSVAYASHIVTLRPIIPSPPTETANGLSSLVSNMLVSSSTVSCDEFLSILNLYKNGLIIADLVRSPVSLDYESAKGGATITTGAGVAG
jgi:hypothetical protein